MGDQQQCSGCHARHVNPKKIYPCADCGCEICEDCASSDDYCFSCFDQRESGGTPENPDSAKLNERVARELGHDYEFWCPVCRAYTLFSSRHAKCRPGLKETPPWSTSLAEALELWLATHTVHATISAKLTGPEVSATEREVYVYASSREEAARLLVEAWLAMRGKERERIQRGLLMIARAKAARREGGE